jgi:hypothetical protein
VKQKYVYFTYLGLGFRLLPSSVPLVRQWSRAEKRNDA